MCAQCHLQRKTRAEIEMGLYNVWPGREWLHHSTRDAGNCHSHIQNGILTLNFCNLILKHTQLVTASLTMLLVWLFYSQNNEEKPSFFVCEFPFKVDKLINLCLLKSKLKYFFRGWDCNEDARRRINSREKNRQNLQTNGQKYGW